MLLVPWPAFLGAIALAYVALNLIFAGLYALDPQGIANAQSFADRYFFSVQTLASIGYGYMYPQTGYTHTVVSLEAMVGVVSIALLTGLSFARFARPTARVMFSQKAVIAPHNRVPTLMFRIANQRHNQVYDAQVSLSWFQDEITAEGQGVRRFYELPLTRSRSPNFRLSWTVYHPIDRDSPLFGQTAADVIERNGLAMVNFSGIDETVGEPVRTRYEYGPAEILWQYRLVDIFETLPNGDRLMDLQRFHGVEPC
ncbi:MAG: ATP-sensitive inward rectifier potassium channel 10 [Oscillatoriales cyanobacterium SM2_1_8]|nr:ATP-sensitive inward rectifier potassium channel 10 [Oscillatoriales cyanobacterium SM2_1_8]